MCSMVIILGFASDLVMGFLYADLECGCPRGNFQSHTCTEVYYDIENKQNVAGYVEDHPVGPHIIEEKCNSNRQDY